jgi:hypothetical protein
MVGCRCHEVSILIIGGIGFARFFGAQPDSKISMTIIRPVPIHRTAFLSGSDCDIMEALLVAALPCRKGASRRS